MSAGFAQAFDIEDYADNQFPIPGLNFREHYYWNRMIKKLNFHRLGNRIRPGSFPQSSAINIIKIRENLCKELLDKMKLRKIEAESIDPDIMRKWKQPAWDRERFERQREDDRYWGNRAAEHGMTLQEWKARDKEDSVEFERSRRKQDWWNAHKKNIVQRKENNITRKHLFLRDLFVIPQIKGIRLCKCPEILSKSIPNLPFFRFNLGCECNGIQFPHAIKYSRVNIERLKTQTWFSHDWEHKIPQSFATLQIIKYNQL